MLHEWVRDSECNHYVLTHCQYDKQEDCCMNLACRTTERKKVECFCCFSCKFGVECIWHMNVCVYKRRWRCLLFDDNKQKMRKICVVLLFTSVVWMHNKWQLHWFLYSSSCFTHLYKHNKHKWKIDADCAFLFPHLKLLETKIA